MESSNTLAVSNIRAITLAVHPKGALLVIDESDHTAMAQVEPRTQA
jgi:cystathionine beta-lyase/cystathionine gamma-synthase